mmetsp:Transcript_1032/g.3723  ORF Transcript_1032/g.3723 Transcript_1032/m.3723 type:complete len:367 (-) Transcript_1032:87-1187(-)
MLPGGGGLSPVDARAHADELLAVALRGRQHNTLSRGRPQEVRREERRRPDRGGEAAQHDRARGQVERAREDGALLRAREDPREDGAPKDARKHSARREHGVDAPEPADRLRAHHDAAQHRRREGGEAAQRQQQEPRRPARHKGEEREVERVRGQSGADDRSLVRLADPPLQRGARRPQQQPLRHSHHDADGGEEDAYSGGGPEEAPLQVEDPREVDGSRHLVEQKSEEVLAEQRVGRDLLQLVDGREVEEKLRRQRRGQARASRGEEGLRPRARVEQEREEGAAGGEEEDGDLARPREEEGGGERAQRERAAKHESHPPEEDRQRRAVRHVCQGGKQQHEHAVAHAAEHARGDEAGVVRLGRGARS